MKFLTSVGRVATAIGLLLLMCVATDLAMTVASASATSQAGFGLTANPSAIDNALPDHTYRVTVFNTGTIPLNVRATLADITRAATGCSITPETLTWAHLSGPAVFGLRPGASVTDEVTVGTPPPGRTEIAAIFIGSAPKTAGTSTVSGGVGTPLRFSQPGTASVEACPKRPTPTAPRPAAAGAASGTSPLALGLTGLAGAATLGLILIGIAAVRRRRRT